MMRASDLPRVTELLARMGHLREALEDVRHVSDEPEAVDISLTVAAARPLKSGCRMRVVTVPKHLAIGVIESEIRSLRELLPELGVEVD